MRSEDHFASDVQGSGELIQAGHTRAQSSVDALEGAEPVAGGRACSQGALQLNLRQPPLAR